MASSIPAKRSPAATSNPLPELRAFLNYLATERGLANNSIHAYRRDLEDADRFFADRRRTLISATPEDYTAYLRETTRRGKATKTLTRRIAAIRTFMKWRQEMGEVVTEYTDLIDRPKPERALPKILSKAQVLRLISAPDPESPFYLRDVAILELLYACGVRATELCELTLQNLNLDVRFIRAFGKGAKERIVPMNPAAVEAIVRYLADCRPGLERVPSPFVFLSRTGKPLERVALWMLVEKYGRSSGLLKEVSPHTLRPLLRQPLTQWRRRPENRSGAFGSR